MTDFLSAREEKYQNVGLGEIYPSVPSESQIRYIYIVLIRCVLIFCLFCWVVVFRYKELISLMYILFISEWAIRLIIYPLTDLGLANDELYSNGMTPGADFAAFVLIALIGLLVLSIKESKSFRS